MVQIEPLARSAARILEVYPLAPTQQGLLFHSLSTPDPEVYQVQVLCTLEGPLDVELFRRAWAAVMDRHAALRTDFDWEEFDEPVQVVHERLEVPFESRDWRGRHGRAGSAALERYLAADRARGFDLAAAPLLRLGLLRAADRVHHLVWSYHHLLLDGWSALRVFADVLTAYAELRERRAPRLPPSPPFREYVEWVRGQELAAAEAWFRDALRGFHRPTPLPAAGGGAAPGHGRVALTLPRTATERLRAFARRRRLTLNTLIEAAWALTLARAGGEEDVVFGVSVANRPPALPDAESRIGLFLSTLPARVPVPGGARVAPWLAALQARQVELRRHAHAPLARIQEWSELPRGVPLFASLLVFENSPIAAAFDERTGGLTISRWEVQAPTHYPLTLTAVPGEELALELRSERRALDEPAAAGLLAAAATLLTALARWPDARLDQLASLPARDRLLLAGCNDTAWPLALESDLLGRFAAQVRRTPGALAVACGGRRLTYRELDRRANRLARHLRSLGADRGALVAVCLDRSEALPLALLAVLKTGAAYLPLDPAYPAARLDWMLRDSGSGLLLTERRWLATLPAGAERVVCCDRDRRAIARCAAEPLDPAVDGEDIAYVIYTSGSTGSPQGVEVTHRSLANLLAAIQGQVELGPADRLLAVTTPCFDIAALELFLPLIAGAAVIVAERAAVADPHRLAALLAHSGATCMQATPAAWRLLLAAGWPGSARLRALCGGEALPRELAERLLAGTAAVYNLYGPTETTIWSLAERVASGSGPVPIGRPLANTRVHLLDRALRPVPVGLPGELFLGGAGLARGYRALPGKTAERFVPDPFAAGPGARLYATGDLARCLPDGRLEFLGRRDHQIKVRGFRVEPAEVEAALLAHPGVREAVVVAVADRDGGSRLAAYLTAGAGEPLSTSELGRWLRRRLPEHLVPAAFVWLAALPLTANGKLDRRALPAPGDGRPALDVALVAARTPAEEQLAAVWAEVLRLERVGIHDDFFDLGGDSIRALQIAVRARQAGFAITPGDLFARRTVAQLAAAGATAEPSAPLPVARPADRAGVAALFAAEEVEDAYPLSPTQHGMLFHALLTPGCGVYFEQVACTLEGRFDREAFAAAWRLVVSRHPVLRSAFVWRGEGAPLQVVLRAVELPWRWEDWREVPPARRDERLAALLAEDREQGFEPARPPLLRHTLIRLGEESHRWIWSFHHALLDGWSLALLLREVWTAYEALRDGRTPRLAPPPAYRGYIDWLASQDRGGAEAYWRRLLAGLTAPTVLDLARPLTAPAESESYGRRETALPDAGALRAAGRRLGVTLHTLLQAAWAILLARYGATREVVFGSTSSGRPAELAGVEAMVGLFVSTLPARVRVPPAARVGPWLQELQAAQVEARRYEHSSLADVQGWSELPPGTPLFEALEVLESYPLEAPPGERPGGLELRDLHLFERTNYPLSLLALPGPPLVLRVLYDRRRFDDGAMERLLGHLRRLLAGLAAADGRRLGELPLLGEEEARQLLLESPAPAAAADGAGSAVELFAAQVALRPQALAVVDGPRRLRYGELAAAAERLSARLRAHGVGAEDRVALVMEPSLELVLGVLGVARCGAAYLPLDPETPAERLRALLADAGARVVLTGRGAPRALLPGAVEIDLRQPAGGTDAVDPGALPDARGLAYVIYTSGSSGRPKGVAVEHASLLNLVRWHQEAYAVTPQDRASLLANPGFDAAVWELWPYLAAGASVHVAPPLARTSASELLAWLAAEEITLAFLPTPVAEAALACRWPAGVALRALLTGGDRLHRAPERPLPCALWNHYGPTEGTVVATWAAVPPAPPEAPVPPLGRPIAGTGVRLLGPDREPVPAGVPGEVCLTGAGLARGYLGRPDATAAAFLPDPSAALPGSRRYRTGDRARLRADGQLEFLGRVDAQLKLRGFRVEPGEVEAALCRHPAVAQAAVAVRGGSASGRRLVAWVVPRPPSGAAAERQAVERWRALYDDTYAQAPASADPALDTVGWTSSYSREPIPSEEMREWVESTVERLLVLRPRRVLEVGCGTGLLLLRLAPRCERYWATDFSRPALDRLRRRLRHPGAELPQVTLLERTADDWEGVPQAGFDLVVLNSVAQYFPSLDYLERVLERALGAVAPGGALFVGDVRSLPLLERFHASLELDAAPGLPAAALRRRVRRRLAREEELCVDPRFFRRLGERLPGVRGVETLLRRGRARNELTRFRYDALLRVGSAEAAAPAAPAWRDWMDDRLDVAAVHRLLAAGPPALALAGVPDARLAAGPAAVAAVDPEELWELAAAMGYEAALGWTGAGGDGRFDALFRRPAAAAPLLARDDLPPPHADELANDPLAPTRRRRLVPELAAFLRRELPPHMMPADFVLLDRLPLTANGKLDRERLPAPDRAPRRGRAAPRNELERRVAAIWADLMGLERVGVHDSFFTLGGHSLLAIQLTTRLREVFAVDLPLRELLAAPTVAGVAAGLAGKSAGRLPPDPLPRAAGEGRGGGIEVNAVSSSTQDPRHDLTARNVADDAEFPDAAFPAPFPLTEIQEAYHRARQDGGPLGGGANVCLELEGDDADGGLVARVEAAFARLIERHAMLRAVLCDGGRQQVLPQVPPFRLAVADLRGRSAAAVAARLGRARRRLRDHVGDPLHWPLFDGVAHRLDGERLRLQLRFDALLLDGPSRRLLTAELLRLVERPDAALAPLRCTYRDYVLARARLSEEEPWRRARDYWLGRLEELPPPPALPRGARIEPAAWRDRVATALEAPAWRRLQQGAARAGLTPSAVVLAAFLDLLAEAAPAARCTIGLINSERPRLHPDIDRVVGNFSDLVLLPASGGGGPFADRAARVQQQMADALDHRAFSGFALLGALRESAPDRFSGALPVLFNSLLAAPHAAPEPGDGEGKGGPRLRLLAAGAYLAQVLLVPTLAESAEGALLCRWQSRERALAPRLSSRLFAAYLRRLGEDDLRV